MGKGEEGLEARGDLRSLSMAAITAAQRSFNRRNSWKTLEVKDETVSALMEKYKVSELVARVAAAKTDELEGIDADYLLDPSLDRLQDLTTIADRPGFEPRAAIARIRKAIENGEKVGIHGDYDSDGIMSSLMLYKALIHYLPKDSVEVFLPGRDSGYGFRPENLDHLANNGATLVISTDCGTRDIATVDHAESRGVDVIVVDHHDVPDGIFVRNAIVVNPRTFAREVAPHFRSFCASGLAWKLARELHLDLLGQVPHGQESDLAFAAAGTVADMVPLTYENRILVYHGLRAMQRPEHIGGPLGTLRRWKGAAYTKAHKYYRQPTAYEIGFKITPLINLGKRLADETVDAKYIWGLLEDDLTRTEQVNRVANINEVQEHKQWLVGRYLKEAKKMIADQETIGHYLVMPGMPEGLCGLLASNLSNDTGHPTIVLTDAREHDHGLLFGSGRCLYPIPLLELVLNVSDMIPAKIGGHPQVVGGLKLNPGDFELFCERVEAELVNWRDSHPGVTGDPPMIHAKASLADWTPEAVYAIEHGIAPYGMGNPETVFASYNVRVKEKRAPMRQDGKPMVNIEYTFEQNGVEVKATSHQSEDKIDRDLGETTMAARDVPEGALVHIMYHVSLDPEGVPFLKLRAAKLAKPLKASTALPTSALTKPVSVAPVPVPA